MRRFSRHMPPVPPGPPLGLGGWLLIGLIVLVMWPVIPLSWLIHLFTAPAEKRKLAALKATREDTICAFRKAFDCRKVDPWIIRATYEKVRDYFPGFPLEASDDLQKELSLELEDSDDLCVSIAKCSGYDLTNTESNPWYDKVRTVGDLVHFINHQPKIRLA